MEPVYPGFVPLSRMTLTYSRKDDTMERCSDTPGYRVSVSFFLFSIYYPELPARNGLSLRYPGKVKYLSPVQCGRNPKGSL
jgi:hypothetical protein